MADYIVFDSEAFENCKNQYSAAQTKVTEAVAHFRKALAALQSDWTGDAYRMAESRAEALQNKIDIAAGRCADAIQELGGVQSVMEQGDSEVESAANNVDAGTASPFAG